MVSFHSYFLFRSLSLSLCLSLSLSLFLSVVILRTLDEIHTKGSSKREKEYAGCSVLTGICHLICSRSACNSLTDSQCSAVTGWSYLCGTYVRCVVYAHYMF